MVEKDPALPHITFVIHDLEGGVAVMNYQIITNADFARYFNVHIVLWRTNEETGKGFGEDFSMAGEVSRFVFSKHDNYYLTLKRFHRLIDSRPGLMVTNDGMELESIRLFGTRCILISIVHDFYNLRLAIENLDLVDYFVCHTEVFTKALLSCHALNDRVKFMIHGVKVMGRRPVLHGGSEGARGPLRLISISRLNAIKGVLLLSEIDRLLSGRGIGVEWVIIGSGDLEGQLRQQWEGRGNVAFHRPDKQDGVYALASAGDVFVSPSNFEGYGIALLEAMSCGLVPVISKLPVGAYSDLPGDVGFSVAAGDAAAFADAIETLHWDRSRLERMGQQATRLIADKYDISKTARNYLECFRESSAARVDKGPKPGQHMRLGLLDRAYVPNSLSRMIKKIR